jgi:hypothetical protein
LRWAVGDREDGTTITGHRHGLRLDTSRHRNPRRVTFEPEGRHTSFESSCATRCSSRPGAPASSFRTKNPRNPSQCR